MMQIGQAQGAYLPTARLLANYVGNFIKAGRGITAGRAVQMANSKIDPAQRFYEVEYNQASLLLAQEFPHITSSAWLIHLRNNIGYRLVQEPICRYGYTVDPVTRQCVQERAPVEVPATPEPPPEPPPEEEKAGMSGTAIILIGLLAVAFLTRR